MKRSRPKQKQTITYTYTYWDAAAKKEVSITLTSGQDGVTEDYIILLKEFDHEADLGDRYEKENRDFDTENKKVRNSENPEDYAADPIENLGTCKTDPAFMIEQESSEHNPLVQQLLTLIPELESQQVDLVYAIYGSLRQLTEIAKEEGVSVAAISNRRNKIIARLKKLFAQKGIL